MTMRLTGFAERLNRAAGLAGLSLKQLAAVSGIPWIRLQRWVHCGHGRRPKTLNDADLQTLLEVLEITDYGDIGRRPVRMAG